MTWQWVVFALIICTTIVIVTGLYFAFRDNTVVRDKHLTPNEGEKR